MASSHAGLKRTGTLILAAVTALTAPAAAAQAHVRSGVIALDQRATPGPAPPGLSVRIDRSDLALRVAAAPGHTLAVSGYAGEPFLRVDRRGVAVQTASPTAVVTHLAARGRGWKVLSNGRTAVWHDARVRAGGAWSVPVRVDGRPARLTGVTERVAAPPWWPWLALAAPFALATVLLLRSERGAVALGTIAALATVGAAVAFAADRFASKGTIVESVNEVLLAVAGLLVLRYVTRPPAARFGVAAGLGTLALFIGLTKFAALTRGVVLSVLPADVSRVLVAVALAAGAGAVVIGTRFFLVADVRREPDA